MGQNLKDDILFTLSIILVVCVGMILMYSIGVRDGTRHYDGITDEEISEIIQSVHDNHDCVNGSYVCSNYTIDAIQQIENLNQSEINTYYVSGIIDQDKSHAFVRVCRDYDVTSGVQSPDYTKYTKLNFYRINLTNGIKIWSGNEDGEKNDRTKRM